MRFGEIGGFRRPACLTVSGFGVEGLAVDYVIKVCGIRVRPRIPVDAHVRPMAQPTCHFFSLANSRANSFLQPAYQFIYLQHTCRSIIRLVLNSRVSKPGEPGFLKAYNVQSEV
jgi:hypothetical protein